jgi:hypothetical protein
VHKLESLHNDDLHQRMYNGLATARVYNSSPNNQVKET